MAVNFTEGAIDEIFAPLDHQTQPPPLRCHHDKYASRVIQLGEEPWRVTVSGAPSLDNIRNLEPLTPEELESQQGVHVTSETLLVTFHSTTLEHEEAGAQTDELLAALRECGRPLIITMPNADTGGLAIRNRIEVFAAGHPLAAVAENLGTRGYFCAMAACAAMVGNSSSALVEAPSFGLPAVNVGNRQRGRVRAKNVLDTGYNRTEIASAIERALDPSFRATLYDLPNPYGDGRAAPRIVSRLIGVPLDRRLVMKRFYDLPAESLS